MSDSNLTPSSNMCCKNDLLFDLLINLLLYDLFIDLLLFILFIYLLYSLYS
jgi:hypothetical protein